LAEFCAIRYDGRGIIWQNPSQAKQKQQGYHVAKVISGKLKLLVNAGFDTWRPRVDHHVAKLEQAVMSLREHVKELTVTTPSILFSRDEGHHSSPRSRTSIHHPLSALQSQVQSMTRNSHMLPSICQIWLIMNCMALSAISAALPEFLDKR